ncbi:MAG: LytR family transcriptional regulator, partial [Thermotoga sp.]|nr:LytR family transcriptional regulator [Thermotoga sp.]
GEVFVDRKELSLFKKKLFEGCAKETSSLNLVVLNISSLVSRVFEANLRGIWKERVGFGPDRVVWEDVGISRSFEGDQVFIAQSGREEEILKILKKAHPSRKFTVHRFDKKEDFEEYYFILKKLAENRIYLDFPVSALILIDDFKE